VIGKPWQNPYVERLIGTIRHECLDHVIVFSERHLRRVLRSYLAYYHGYRTHPLATRSNKVTTDEIERHHRSVQGLSSALQWLLGMRSAPERNAITVRTPT
jgi:hypothetical protein